MAHLAHLDMPNKTAILKIAITSAVLYGAYRLAPNSTVKAMVLGVAGVAVSHLTYFL